MKVIKILNKKYVEEINKNIYLNKKTLSEDNEEEYTRLDDIYKEKKYIHYQHFLNKNTLQNRLSELSNNISPYISDNNNQKVKVYICIIKG